MQYKSSRALVETAMMISIATILCLVIHFIPFLGVLNLAVPVPIALIGKRHGLKWSLLCTLVTGILINLFAGPIQAFFEITSFGLIGVWLGESFRRRWAAIYRLSIPAVLFVVSMIGQFTAVQYLMGISILDHLKIAYLSSIDSSIELLKSTNNPAFSQTLSSLEETRREGWQQMMLIIPAGLALAGSFIAYANNIICQNIFKRLRIDINEFPPIILWHIPRYVIIIFFGAGLLNYYAGSNTMDLLQRIAVNLNILASIALWIEGIAFLRFFFFKKNISSKLFFAIMILSFFMPILASIIMGAGIMELIMQIRKREGVFENPEQYSNL